MNATLITATNFTDNSLPVAGDVFYYVKAVEMKTTPSGSFENESLAARIAAVSTVGVNEENVNDVIIYPNPSTDFVTIQLAENEIGKLISIVDENGKLVYTEMTTESLVKLNVTKFLPGVYFVKTADQNVGSFVKM